MKRGLSGLSLLVGVNKPKGLSSHDVVNRCRRIFKERRVGHCGTLDPLASGVLPIAVGPATRLNRYLSANTKSYRATIQFGMETTTDDITGEVLQRAACPQDLMDGSFAEAYIAGLVGKAIQQPPAYSAIKVDGKKSYEMARQGKALALEPRTITIYKATLIDRNLGEEQLSPSWVVDFTVSKGTYIRSLARDIGRELGCFGTLAALKRTASGAIDLEHCYSLETLEKLGVDGALDPVAALAMDFAFGDEHCKALENGEAIAAEDLIIYEALTLDEKTCGCCSSNLIPQAAPQGPGSPLAMVLENSLKAIYRLDRSGKFYRPETVFAVGVLRG